VVSILIRWEVNLSKWEVNLSKWEANTPKWVVNLIKWEVNLSKWEANTPKWVVSILLKWEDNILIKWEDSILIRWEVKWEVNLARWVDILNQEDSRSRWPGNIPTVQANPFRWAANLPRAARKQDSRVNLGSLTISQSKLILVSPNNTLDNPRWTLDNPKCTLDNPRWTLDNPKYTLDNPRWTLDNPKCTLDNPRWILDNPKCTLDNPKCTLDNLNQVNRSSNRHSTVYPSPFRVTLGNLFRVTLPHPNQNSLPTTDLHHHSQEEHSLILRLSAKDSLGLSRARELTGSGAHGLGGSRAWGLTIQRNNVSKNDLLSNCSHGGWYMLASSKLW
jgi:hypothetical protein